MSLADREHLPKIVTDVDGIRDILLALDPEIVLLREDISQLIKELYVSTTEKYIDRWEQDFSLPYDGSLTLEQRRQRIKNKLARKKVLNWQNLRLLIENNVVKPRFYIVNEAENYHFKIFLEQQPQRQEFDLSKFTVVGSPTITSDGIASGFSSKSSGTENYLTFPTVFNPENKPWKIVIKATIGTWISGAPYASLLGTGIQAKDWQGVALALAPNNQISCWFSSTGTGWDIGNIRKTFSYTIGETYYFKVEFTGTKYVLSVSQDNKNWDIKGSIESTTPIYVSSQPLAIGDNKFNNAVSTCWTGSIDLKQFSITVDGKEVFSGVKNIDYITNELRTSLKQAKPAYLTFDLIVTEFFTRYCGTFSSGTEPL